MGCFNCFALGFFVALSLASIDVGVAARHLQQLPPMPTLPTTTLPPFPSIPISHSHPYHLSQGLGRFLHFLPCLLCPHCLVYQGPHCPLYQACLRFPQSQLQFPLFHSSLHHLLLLVLKNPFR
ncbi:hypothetical protein ES288_D13G058800v1 [Gossypium darwinii]|uniref:Uncharacterized protein n=1 Tax=Gossypium darwinii TaxID=34276 RepID=A0A5D1ZW57_GOSDA|nr:hypothetical protein ES288_D13G058800v1 [Gossypium darwinii]